jgi:hypothetical protein
MVTGHALTRVCRQPGYSTPGGPGSAGPPAFMTVPTNCAAAAVRKLHVTGAGAAKSYLAASKVGTWTTHTNPSMASGAQAVIDGFDWYVASDRADGRMMHQLERQAVVPLPAGDVNARVDVVLVDGSNLAGRIVLWDGPRFDPSQAPVMACVFAHALASIYPGRSFTTVGLWQARRQQLVEVPYADALSATAQASAIRARM